VSIGYVEKREDIASFLTTVKHDKKYARATHNSWAARITKDAIVYETKNDDGEHGAGAVILRVLQQQQLTNCIICVTRWFGGTKLMNDRFKHLQTASMYAIHHMRTAE
jgi:putative IMPACT (imprinted ancient) family translation regulator